MNVRTLYNEMRWGALSRRRKRWVRLRDVAEYFGTSLKLAQAVLARLAERGDVEVQLDPKDGRKSRYRVVM